MNAAAAPARPDASAAGRRGVRPAVVIGAVVLVAAVLRFGVVVASKGGFSGNVGYDPSVYYTAADALSFGRLPYRDFVLLHPPGLMLALVPFAVLGRLTTDHTGFVVANAVFTLIGAANAGLVVAVARRAGLTLRSAAIGGAFYAVWFGAVDAEFTIRLEPLAMFAFLAALLLLVRVRAQRVRWTALAGVALGVALGVKIWWIVPVVALVVWLVVLRVDRRHVAALVGGTALSTAAICLPFFLAAPSDMFRMVVRDQFGRHEITRPWQRVADLSSLHDAAPGLHGALQVVVVLAVGFVAVAVVVQAWRVRPGRLFGYLLLAQLVVLAASPSYFYYYSDYVAGTLALVVAAAAEPRSSGRLRQVQRATPLVAVTLALALTITALTHRPGSAYFPGNRLAASVARVHCLLADSPMALIELDVLSKGLARGCPNWVDVTGRTYDVDAPTDRAKPSRKHNLRWQKDIVTYLRSGDAFLVIRGETGLKNKTLTKLVRLPVLSSVGGYTVHLSHRPKHSSRS
jgi:alpha-1,2-mannosyltransferase